MSPNSYLKWNKHGLLEAFMGENESETPVFTWECSTFDDILDSPGAVTPSMYQWMASYVESNITKDDLWEIAADSYCDGPLEERAVDEYFDIPILDRMILHEQMMTNLKAELAVAEAKEAAYINMCLDDECPFDVNSPVYVDYCKWCRAQKEEWSDKVKVLKDDLSMEETWTSGAEEGAEDALAPEYDVCEI